MGTKHLCMLNAGMVRTQPKTIKKPCESMQVSIEREFIFPNSKQANRGQIVSETDDAETDSPFVGGRACDMLVLLYLNLNCVQ